jgi:hypothetical protein
MNMTKVLLKLSLVLLLSACSHVDFDNPFPRHQKSLDSFGRDLIGKYYYSDSFALVAENIAYNSRYYSTIATTRDSIALISAEIEVSPKIITYSIEYKTYYKISKFDTSALKKKDPASEKVLLGEYLVIRETMANVLADLTKQDRLTLYNGIYYINHFVGEPNAKDTSSSINFRPEGTHWSIWQFENKGGNNYSLNSTNREDYNMLFDTTKFWQPIFPIAHVTDKQFKKFVSKGGFHEKYRLKKYVP